jgi:uncharacterized phage-associated protein
MAEKTGSKTELAVADESLFSGLTSDVVDSLSPAKMRMIMMYLTGQYTQKQMAAIVNVSDNTIRAWLLDPLVQEVIKEIQQREFAVIDGQLKALRHKAMSTMNELMDSTMDNVRYQAAKDILDRGGHKAQQTIKVDKTVTTLEQQLATLADFTIEDAEVIDIDDILTEVKDG